MASKLEVPSRARRITALALLTFAAAITAGLIAGSAPGGWQAAGASSQSFGRVLITGDHVTGLYPGATRKLTLTLHNSDPTQSIVVRSVQIRDIRTTKRSCAPSRRNLRIEHRSGAFRIGAGGRRRTSVLLEMPNTVANACQGAVFKLRFVAQTRVPAR
jgi:hypothetical protein